jgi:hypothetical protein
MVVALKDSQLGVPLALLLVQHRTVASRVESWAENWAVLMADYLAAQMVALRAALTADYWAA